ncbi:MAG: WYL domain-containing protein, partial [Deltaproteobacteria bacterium]|nr:WYL domain-containing protein [Deltaproteobacteria bacterium]
MPSAASPIVLGNPLARQICFLLAEQPMDLATLCKRSQRCERQVRRALDELRRLGIQLHTERQRGRGSPKVYSLPPDHAPLQLLLNRLDALALRFLLVRGRPRADEPYHAEVAQLEAKLKAVLDLPGRALYPKLERILPESRPAPPGGVVEEEGNEGSEPGEPTGVQAITDDLLAAACYHHVCDIRYRTSAGEERIHPIHPLIVFQRKGRWYVDAWEPGAGEVHRYALPRFLEVRRRLGEHFEPPADYDASASMAGPMGAFHD